MEKTKRLTTSAFMVAVAAVLALGVYLLPIAQGIICIVGLPLVILGVKYDWKAQLLATVALVLVLMTLDPIYAVMILFLIGPMALIQGYFIKFKKPTSELIFFSTLAFVFGVLILLYLSTITLGIDIIEETSLYTTQLVDELKVMYSNMNVLDDAEMQTFLAGLDQMKTIVVMMVPAVIVIFSLFNSVLSVVITAKVFKRLKLSMNKTYFKDFRIDQGKRNTLMLVMLVVTIVAIVDRSNTDYYLFNFMSILMLLLQINGLALIWFFTEKHPNRKALRTLTIIAYLISPAFVFIELLVRYGLALMGLFDMYINFREKIQRKII